MDEHPMMYDPDVMVYLYADDGPGDNLALSIIYMADNQHLFVPAPPRQFDIIKDRAVRSKTEPLDEDESRCDKKKGVATNNAAMRLNGPCLKILSSHPSRTKRGHVAGRNPDSYLVLPNAKGISWEHFAFAYDNNNQLVVRDLGSTVGTRVLYFEEEDSTPGFNMDFSAQGPEILGGRPAVIKLRADIRFKLVMPNHDTSSAAYLERVQKFRQNTAPIDDLLPGLGLASRTMTELPTPADDGIEAASDVPGAILWTKQIGKGGFALVCYAWDVTTRKEYALKKPLEGYYDRDMWIKEAKILKSLRHDNIVQLKHAILGDGRPELYFEYLGLGSLVAYQPISNPFQQKQSMLQVFSGLVYLHDRKVPIVHRDIKPENILVQRWNAREVRIKLGDFGLAKEGRLLKTFCGDFLYLAPEGYTLQTKAQYSPKVDVWSAGVLAVWLETGQRPKWLEKYQSDGKTWAKLMIKFAEEQLQRCGTNELLTFALDYMLITHPADRADSRECRTRAQEIVTEEAAAYSETEAEAESPDTLEGDNSNDNSQPNDGRQSTTPRVALTEPSTSTQDLNLAEKTPTIGSSLISELGRRDDSVIDSFLGVGPVNKADFEAENWGSGAATPITVQGGDLPQLTGSMANGRLWNGSPVINSVEGEDDDEEEQRGRFEHEQAGAYPSFSDLISLLPRAAGDDGNAILTESALSVQIKRQLEEAGEEDDTTTVVDGYRYQLADPGAAGHRKLRKRSKLTHDKS